MSDTLDKKKLLKELDGLAYAYDQQKKGHKTSSAVRAIIICIERGQFDTKEPAE